MKKLFSEPKGVFTLLVIVAILAILVGGYLGVTLGMQANETMSLLCGLGLLMWAWAWGEFLVMCLRLRKGETAFTPATGRTLLVIGLCMVGLAAVTAASAYLGGTRDVPVLQLIEFILLPLVFLGVAVVAQILRGLLTHAMALEERQEGIV